jgi:triphosphoribosyl-dephospho-CoA synthase
MTPLHRTWPLAEAVQLACLLEASAPKLGNVHPGAAFDDMHFGHFVASAIAIRAPFATVPKDKLTNAKNSTGVGARVLAACQATREQVGCNTNLGTLLLFAPLAIAVQSGIETQVDLRAQVAEVLDRLTAEDSRCIYEAIRVAQPGGLGRRESQDISDDPPQNLRSAMAQVAETDAVARQYVNSFEDIFERLLPWLNAELAVQGSESLDPLDSICRLQIRWLAHEPDGLIVRKLGLDAAKDVQSRAQAAWQRLQDFSGKVGELDSVCELDQFLRADGNRRNPGTTADLIAATLLVRLLVGGNPCDKWLR